MNALQIRRLFSPDPPQRHRVDFNDGPVVHNDDPLKSITARFFIGDRMEYQVNLKPGMWGKCFRRYCSPWRVEILDHGGNRIAKHHYDPAGKQVRINLDSKSLGDTLAWIPQVARFADLHPQTKVFCSHFWPDLGVEKTYPQINFIKPDEELDDIYATYVIGYFVGDHQHANHPVDPKTIPLAKIAADILAIPYTETRTEIAIEDRKNRFKSAYVCFSMESTAGCKLWQYPNGWQHIADHINARGLIPVLIQKGEADLANIVNKSGNLPIQDRVTDLLHCEMFIGLASGLSWLAWALNKKVVMISGFSEPFTEFQQDCYRVMNSSVCYGCWNDPAFSFDRSDWDWCPAHKASERQFECSKAIDPEMVIDAIETALQTNSLERHRALCA